MVSKLIYETSFFYKLQQTFERNVKSGVQQKVDQLTDWVSNLVVEKKDGSLRLCLDPKI